MFIYSSFAANPRAVAIAGLTLLTFTPAFGQAATEQKEQPKPEWSLVNISKVRADMRQNYEGIQKEISAAYQKASRQRVVLETLVGDRNEYVSVAPLPNWAEMDGPSVLVRSLGDGPAGKLLARARAVTSDLTTFATLARNDLSIRTP